MVPNKNIEDQFTDAVKLALKAGGTVGPSLVMTTENPRQARRHKLAHRWFVAFLFERPPKARPQEVE